MKGRLSYAMQVTDDEVYLVVNAGCREKDITHMQKHLDSFSVRSILVAAITCPISSGSVTTFMAKQHTAHQVHDAPACATGQVRAGRA